MNLKSTISAVAIGSFLLSSTAHADCSSRTYNGPPLGQNSVQLKHGLSVSIVGEAVVTRSSNGQIDRHSALQQDAGPPTDLIALSDTRFVVIGPVSSYMGFVTESADGTTKSRLEELPTVFDTPCDFWGRFNGTCPIVKARFSKALNAVIVSGWENSNAVRTLKIGQNSQPEPLELTSGEALLYLGDDHNGMAVFRTKGGIGYKGETISSLAPCGKYPPLK